MTRADLERHQLEQLRALLAALVPANGFYAPRLGAAELDGEVPDLETFTRRMPLTTKQQLVEDQQAHPPFGTNLTFPLSQYNRFHQTSGTTRAPMTWLDTPASWDWMLGNWRRVFEAAGVGPADRVFFAFSFGPFLGFWTAFEAAAQIGCLCLPGGGLSSAARLAVMISNGATVLCCTPTYALRLAEVAEQEGIDLAASPVRTIIVAGEPGGALPAVRAKIRAAWHGARVCDHHGMTEVGPVTYECPSGAHATGSDEQPVLLRVIEASYLAEVIDPASFEPVAPGEVGELVLTTLGRTGSPLLRYRTGDLVRPAPATTESPGSAPSDGGTTAPRPAWQLDLALVGGILGRADDMVTIRGVNVFPVAVDDVVRGVEDVAEYRVEVRTAHAMSEMKVFVEPSTSADGEALAARVRQALRDALALRVEVEVAAPGSLPRFEMKARRWQVHTQEKAED